MSSSVRSASEVVGSALVRYLSLMSKAKEECGANAAPCDESLIDAEEVSRMTLLSTNALAMRRRRRMGPPFVNLGGRTPRYRRSEVLAWIDACSKPPIEPGARPSKAVGAKP